MVKTQGTETTVASILAENARRHTAINAVFNPISGEGVGGKRKRLEVEGLPVQFIPQEMWSEPFVQKLRKAGGLGGILTSNGLPDTRPNRETLAEKFVRIRVKYDFCFWAALLIFIKPKSGGHDVNFILNRPQRHLLEELESMRLQGLPIRIILLKARQWGGSTLVQFYMAWIQLVHVRGENSLIVAQVKDTATEIKDMYKNALEHYPLSMLHGIGESYNPNEAKMEGVGNTGNIHRIPQRGCKIKTGSMQKPDSARGGDYSLVHCSEVALWEYTEKKTPEQVIRSACSGVLYKPYTLIVYESTANGTNNFFCREYRAAKSGNSQFHAVFIPWYEIEQNEIHIADTETFARELWENRHNENVKDSRHEPGAYLWKLWERGATLEAINWYILERTKFTDHADMAAESPSDDLEAFAHTGANVFDREQVEAMRERCKPPRWVGDLHADGIEGAEALSNLKFQEDKQGLFHIWNKPEIPTGDTYISDRYVVAVDIGGTTSKSDWSVICVLDRLNQMDSETREGPVVVAQWRGHIPMDLLAWKSMQVAAYYDNALLVIEKNTLDTHKLGSGTEGEQATYILGLIKELYPNLYARRQTEEEIRDKKPVTYGYHTNTKTKPILVSTLQGIVRDGLYTERDSGCLDEFDTYERHPEGGWDAAEGCHDDMLMTRAIALRIAYHEMAIPQLRKKNQTIAMPKRMYPKTVVHK